MAPATLWEPAGKLSPRKRRQRIRLFIAAALIAAYAFGTWYFSGHFTPGTTVDGIDASLMTEAELAQALEDRAASYEQHITYQDVYETTVRGADMGLSFDGTKVATEARQRANAFLWLPYLLSPQHMLIDGNIQVDKDALFKLIQPTIAAYNKQAEPPTNASASYDKKEKSFVITSESVGTALTTKPVVEKSLVASRGLASEVELGAESLKQPKIHADNKRLVAVVKKANDMLAKPLDIVSDDTTITTIKPDTMASWMTINKKRKLVIEGVYNWVEGNDAIKAAGNAIDDEHVWALDTQATCDAIHAAMDSLSGEPVEVARIALETKPPVTPGAKERGRHIDVNLTTQFVRFYDSDGKVIWDSYCVTGGWDPEFQRMHATPTGEYAIQAKETNRTLVGADTNNDGKPDYESFVYYWMPFLAYDYGFHDATWRYEDAFGGDIYTYYGSHGCINLPYPKAEALFNLVQVGDPVYIHE